MEKGEPYDWMYGIWFCGGKNGVDWMASLFKLKGQWVLEWRFRYYNPESKNPHDKKDEKNFYRAVSPGDTTADRDKMIEGIKLLTPHLEKQFKDKVDFCLLDCAADDPKFFFELSQKSWAHVKIERDAK